jgi:TPR repeat protein
MSLEDIIPNASLERHGYHELSEEQLRLKGDPEALLHLGIRLWHGIGVRRNGDGGWEAIVSSAKLGHPVALALCFFYAKGTETNGQRAMELLRDSASRGHAAGI